MSPVILRTEPQWTEVRKAGLEGEPQTTSQLWQREAPGLGLGTAKQGKESRLPLGDRNSLDFPMGLLEV